MVNLFAFKYCITFLSTENDYQSQNSPSVQNENEMMNNLNIRCEKLQDAMLSLQEENMKLNK